MFYSVRQWVFFNCKFIYFPTYSTMACLAFLMCLCVYLYMHYQVRLLLFYFIKDAGNKRWLKYLFHIVIISLSAMCSYGDSTGTCYCKTFFYLLHNLWYTWWKHSVKISTPIGPDQLVLLSFLIFRKSRFFPVVIPNIMALFRHYQSVSEATVLFTLFHTFSHSQI